MISTTPTHHWAYIGEVSLTSECFYRLKTAYNARSGVPTKAGVISMSICIKKWRNAPVSANQELSIASRDSCYVHGMSWLSPSPTPIPPFWLMQNLSSNGLHQLITCGQSCMRCTLVISGLKNAIRTYSCGTGGVRTSFYSILVLWSFLEEQKSPWVIINKTLAHQRTVLVSYSQVFAFPIICHTMRLCGGKGTTHNRWCTCQEYPV